MKKGRIKRMGILSVAGLTGCESDWREAPSSHQEGVWDLAFVHPLIGLLEWFHRWLGNYGGAILVGTLLFRMWLLPLVFNSLKRSSAWKRWTSAVAALLPKSRRPWTIAPFLIPFFPLLYQLPVIVALYQVVRGDPHIGESRFLWLLLGQPDPWFLLPLAAGWTTAWQGWQESPSDVRHHVGLVLTRLAVFVCTLAVPSALSLYWLTSNVSSRLRQWEGERPKAAETPSL
ncbi:YidC/Oxa1 family membrane protein insertase [Desmospora profundinema]|uniref:YidC/Oxa1 family membrane protein insertase n=1 Tax=Desmospora profundinema TaxID=1571184 RepID=A0ABU1IQ29_9BACL|nr:YidC/Oxa1 family membrane protein insertase [Desmospora profundinema]MDR6226642.1 YidC/Oxa1 family membrane protein insertase [Desmospora profundinema]